MSWESGLAVDSDVAQLRRGDLDALSALVTRYQNRLYRYLLRVVAAGRPRGGGFVSDHVDPGGGENRELRSEPEF